jgi:C_GCAxxG_C_C family probable redox protein
MAVTDDDFPTQVRGKAETHFRKGRFFCSEAVLRAIIDASDMQDRREIVALASGFATGMGGAGCSCGAVVGGMMALGLFFGRSTPGDPKVRDCMEFAHELHDQFREKHNSICCRVLNKDLVQDSPEQIKMCVLRTGDAAELAAVIIAREQKRYSS